jgi:DNA polymerase-1
MEIYFIGEEGLFEDGVKYTTLDDAYEYLKEQQVISIDIETTRKFNGKYGDEEGLSPYLSKIVMFQIGTLERQYIIDHRYHTIGKLTELLTDVNILKVGHNLKFEYLHILHNYGVRIENIYDTQISEMVLTCGLKDVKVSLEACIEKYLNITVQKETRLEFLKIKDRPFSYKQLKYGADDILLPLKIKELQEKEIEKWQLQNVLDLELKYVAVLGDIEYKGMYFDADAWTVIYNDNLPIYHKAKEKLNNFVIKYFSDTKFVSKQLDLFNPPGCNIMWSSSTQVVELFKHMNACPQDMIMNIKKKKKELKYTVNATVLLSSLHDLNKDQPQHIKDFILDYVKCKELEQSVTTFGLEFLKHINPITKRIHSNYWQIIATGRMSSKNPNLQNIPSEDRYRKCFTCDQFHDIVNADYSGQETVVLANVSREPNIGKLIIEGGDMHCFVTKAINPELKDLSDDEIKTKHKNKRQVAKAAGFAIQYGGTGYTIAKNLGITEEEGDKVYDAYFKAFPQLRNYFNSVKNTTLRLGYVLIDTVTYRKSFFAPPRNNGEKHAVEKKALNFPIQGTSGSMTKYAGILFRRWILDNKLQDKVFITNIIHDELNVECEKTYSQSVKENLESCMLQSAEIWCKEVPMKASAVITNYWGH